MRNALESPTGPSEELLVRLQQKIPDIFHIRDRLRNFNSVFHTAAAAGNLARCLDIPLLSSISSVDDLRTRNARSESCLLSTVRSLQYSEVLSVFRKFEESSFHVSPVCAGDEQESSASSLLDGIVISGWLTQSNDGVVWKTYFHDLTKESILYYSSEERSQVRVSQYLGERIE